MATALYVLARDLHEPVAVAPGLRLDGVRVLLVEDDEDTREVLTLGLELRARRWGRSVRPGRRCRRRRASPPT